MFEKSDRRRPVRMANTSSGGSIPVDRGWAWVVMAAAFGIYGLHGAAFKVQGIVYIEMLEHFSSDQQLTLWVFSVAGLVMLCSGPLVSWLIHKTSHRAVLLLGTVTIFLGIVLTGYLPLMEASFFSWSVLYGFGHCCLLMASLTCTAEYFVKYRGLAVGITAAGSGALSFVLPVILRYLFDTLPFDGALLLYGGVVCQLFAMAMLVRPASYYATCRPPSQLQHLASVKAAEDEQVSCRKGGSVPSEAVDLTISLTAREATSTANADRPSSDRQWLHQYLGDDHARGCQALCHLPSVQRADETTAKSPPEPPTQFSPHRNAPLPPMPPVTATSPGNAGRSAKQLLRDPAVWLISVSMMFFANGINIVYTVIPPYGESIDVSKETVSMLLAVGGGVEVVCRALHGWFSDRKVVSTLLQLAACSGITGLASVLCPLLDGSAGIGLLSAMCGAAGTSAFSLVPVVLHELMEQESVTTALGLQMFMRGFSFILSTFVAGLVVDETGSWDGVFHYIGANMFVSTLITILLYLWTKRRRVCSGRLSSVQDIPGSAVESLTVGLT